MSRTTLAAALALAAAFLLGTPAASAAPGDVVAEGHISAGVFGASIVSYAFFGYTMLPAGDGTYGFTAPISGLDGARLVTDVHDNTGAGYFVKVSFRAADGRTLASECEYGDGAHGLLQQPFGTAQLAENCIVPSGATLVEVTAHTGLLLDVTLRLA